MAAKEIAINGARWPDISVECEVLGRSSNATARDPGTTRERILASSACNRAAVDIAPLLEDVGVAP